MAYRTGSFSLQAELLDSYKSVRLDFEERSKVEKLKKGQKGFNPDIYNDVSDMNDYDVAFRCLGVKANDSRIAVVSKEQAVLLRKLGFYEASTGNQTSRWLTKTRDWLVKHAKYNCSWVGAEIESVLTISRMRYDMTPTNIFGVLKGPSLKSVMELMRELKDSDLAFDDVDKIVGRTGVTLSRTELLTLRTQGGAKVIGESRDMSDQSIKRAKFGLISRAPPQSDPIQDGQKKLASIEFPFIRVTDLMILLGGSPGTRYRNKEMPWKSNTRIIVIDPRKPEFECEHINAMVRSNAEFMALCGRDITLARTPFIHMDIRSDKEVTITSQVRMIVAGSGSGKTWAISNLKGEDRGKFIDADTLYKFPPGDWWRDALESEKVTREWGVAISTYLRANPGVIVLGAIDPALLQLTSSQVLGVYIDANTMARNEASRQGNDLNQPDSGLFDAAKRDMDNVRKFGGRVVQVRSIYELLTGRHDKRNWEEGIKRDHLLMNSIASSVRRANKNAIILQKARLFGSITTLNFNEVGWPLFQPYTSINSGEFRFLYSGHNYGCAVNLGVATKSIRAVEMSDALQELSRMRSRFGAYVDFKLSALWANMSVVTNSRIPEISNGIGWFSVSNSLNSRLSMLEMMNNGMLVTAPYGPIDGERIVSQDVNGRTYSDHTISLLDELESTHVFVPLYYLMSMAGAQSHLSALSTTTIVVNPPGMVGRQEVSAMSTQLVKYVSQSIRRIWPHATDDMMYGYRRQVLLQEHSRVCNLIESATGRKVEISMIDGGDAGDYMLDGEVTSVSGHMIYILLGSVFGIPYGIERYLREKMYNAVTGDSGYEGNNIIKKREVWHYLSDDIFAVLAVKACLGVLGYASTVENVSRLSAGLDALIARLIVIGKNSPWYVSKNEKVERTDYMDTVFGEFSEHENVITNALMGVTTNMLVWEPPSSKSIDDVLDVIRSVEDMAVGAVMIRDVRNGTILSIDSSLITEDYVNTYMGVSTIGYMSYENYVASGRRIRKNQLERTSRLILAIPVNSVTP